MTLNGHAHFSQAASDLLGEIIAATSTDFVAQACQLDAAPPFGAFVRATGDDGLTVFGIVARVETAGIDPGARPIMRGHDGVRDEQIYAENPDLPHVLRTIFRAQTVGFAQDGVFRQFLPPRPPRLHYSVFSCAPLEVRQFTDVGLDYLAALLNAVDLPADELVAANVRLVAAQRGDEFTRLAGRELAQLLRTDYARLTSVLRRCLGGLEVLAR